MPVDDNETMLSGIVSMVTAPLASAHLHRESRHRRQSWSARAPPCRRVGRRVVLVATSPVVVVLPLRPHRQRRQQGEDQGDPSHMKHPPLSEDEEAGGFPEPTLPSSSETFVVALEIRRPGSSPVKGASQLRDSTGV